MHVNRNEIDSLLTTNGNNEHDLTQNDLNHKLKQNIKKEEEDEEEDNSKICKIM